MELGLPPLYKAQKLASKHAIKYISYSPLNLFQIVIFSTNKLRFEPSTQPEVTGGQVWGMECKIGRAHVRTPVTEKSRMPSSA